jgi:predicted phosphate transport protein (TIGR00153 family)
VAQCGPLFVSAVQAYFDGNRDRFELLKEDIREIEAEADRMKRNIRSHLPASILMPVDKSVFFSFLREADKVVDCIKNSLYWMSYYQLDLPEDITHDYILLAKEVNDYIGFLPEMVRRADAYFSTRMDQDRIAVKEIIREIRFREKESDDLEKALFIRLCADEAIPPRTFFLTIRLVETTGDIADHLENSADMVRVMIAR